MERLFTTFGHFGILFRFRSKFLSKLQLRKVSTTNELHSIAQQNETLELFDGSGDLLDLFHSFRLKRGAKGQTEQQATQVRRRRHLSSDSHKSHHVIRISSSANGAPFTALHYILPQQVHSFFFSGNFLKFFEIF